jgi:hypothetical protein
VSGDGSSWGESSELPEAPGRQEGPEASAGEGPPSWGDTNALPEASPAQGLPFWAQPSPPVEETLPAWAADSPAESDRDETWDDTSASWRENSESENTAQSRLTEAGTEESLPFWAQPNATDDARAAASTPGEDPASRVEWPSGEGQPTADGASLWGKSSEEPPQGAHHADLPPSWQETPSGGVEVPAGRAAEETESSWFAPRREEPDETVRDAEDVRAAPVEDEDTFDGFAEGPGDPNYVPVVPSAPSTPPKPGKPSSSNWAMPDWIEDETEDKGKGRRKGKRRANDPDDELPARDRGTPPAHETVESRSAAAPTQPQEQRHDSGKGSRVGLLLGIGLLVAALIAAAAVYVMNRGEKAEPSDPPRQVPPSAGGAELPQPQVELPKSAQLPTYRGKPTRIAGRIADQHAGLSYPRFAAPWQVPTRRNRLGTQGWSGQQVLVTEKRANRLWYGQLLTGTLQPTLMEAYKGPESLQTVTVMASDGLLAQYYAFPHTKRGIASQQLKVGGRKGWLIGTQLRYKRPGVRATGELVVVAVIDTGRPTPAVVFTSMPNTHRNLWPDINRFIGQLKPFS